MSLNICLRLGAAEVCHRSHYIVVNIQLLRQLSERTTVPWIDLMYYNNISIMKIALCLIGDQFEIS
jgi:hypothetical protein